MKPNHLLREIAAIGVILLVVGMGEPAYAGSLNANEQELMGIISGTYTYNGVTYRVKPQYVQVARGYLMQDNIDCTDEQKQKAINQMYSSIQQGIDEGYLEPAYPQTVSAASGGEGNAAAEAENGNAGSVANQSDAGAGDGIGETAIAGQPDQNPEAAAESETVPETEVPTKSEYILSLEAYAEGMVLGAADVNEMAEATGMAGMTDVEGDSSVTGGENEVSGITGDASVWTAPGFYEFPVRTAWAVCAGVAVGMAGLFMVSLRGKLLVRRHRHHDKGKWGRPG